MVECHFLKQRLDEEELVRVVATIWIEQTEGAKFWLRVMNELKNRGAQDILIAVVDGLKGFPEAINAVFPQTVIQTCIVHLIRHSMDFAARPKGSPAAKKRLLQNWWFLARTDQRPPNLPWQIWLFMAGRGAGKTRTGAEYTRASVLRGCRRLGLVAPTAGDCRDTMVEGSSGLLFVSSEEDFDCFGNYVGVPAAADTRRIPVEAQSNAGFLGKCCCESHEISFNRKTGTLPLQRFLLVKYLVNLDMNPLAERCVMALTGCQ